MAKKQSREARSTKKDVNPVTVPEANTPKKEEAKKEVYLALREKRMLK